MRPDDFYVDEEDAFGEHTRLLNVDMFDRIRRRPLPDRQDIEVAVPLARFVHDDFERFGTNGHEELTEQQMRGALLALRAVVDRLGIISFEVPFRDFSTFRSWWIRNGASGSWQARRDLLHGIFE